MTAAGDVDALPVKRAANLDEPEPDRRWLVEPLWSRAGVGIIGGSPKLGKTWLALDIALSVATGTSVLDHFDVPEPGPVLAFFAEDSLTAVKERLTALCRYRGIELAAVPIDVITSGSLRLDLDHDRLRLAETLRRSRAKLLLLDPFVRLHHGDE